jgi:hypothetical protein
MDRLLLRQHSSMDRILKIRSPSRPPVAAPLIIHQDSSKPWHPLTNLIWAQEESTRYFTTKILQWMLMLLLPLAFSILLKANLEEGKVNRARINHCRWQLLAIVVVYRDRLSLRSRELILPSSKDYYRLVDKACLILRIPPLTYWDSLRVEFSGKFKISSIKVPPKIRTLIHKDHT